MIDLNFTIENQILSRKDSVVIVNKSRNYIMAYFKFITSDWMNVDKFAIFKDENDEAYNIHLGTGCECSCIIPHEVLKGDYFRVTVYGGNLITTTELTIISLHSGYTTDVHALNDGETDVFTELFSVLNTKIDDILFSDGLLKIYSNGELVKTIDIAHDDLTNGLMQVFHSEVEETLTDYVRFDGISFTEDGILKFE